MAISSPPLRPDPSKGRSYDTGETQRG